MKVLVTGASGFVGREMVRQLSRQDDLRIAALTRDTRHCSVNTDTVTWVSADITDGEAILRTVSGVVPDTVIHLAALNQGSLRDLFRTNVIGTSNLLEAVIQANPACRIIVISSSAVYGYAGEAPIDEDIPCAPLSLYGVSKVAEEHTAMMFYHTRGADVAIVRPFNLVGPGLPTTLVCGHIIEQVLAADQKGDNLIELAESVSRRDFVDVRDLVRGIRALATLPDFHGRCAGRH
jgi:nucleoside-diphosphate-sugar epimerase